MLNEQHIKDEIKERRLRIDTLDRGSHQTGDSAVTPATPQDIQHSRANPVTPLWGSEFNLKTLYYRGGCSRNCCWAERKIVDFGDFLTGAWSRVTAF
jgi:hypothetical protein